MSESIFLLADDVVNAVNAARSARVDESVTKELEAILHELAEVKRRLASLSQVVVELPMPSGSFDDFDTLERRIGVFLTAVADDPIGAARSDDAGALLADLRREVEELGEAAVAAWSALREALRPESGTEFLRQLNDLPGFSLGELIADHVSVLQAVATTRLPDAGTIRDAKAARQRLDSGLESLRERMPNEEVRHQLEGCFRNELRLMDVTPEFLVWIEQYGLEAAFLVKPA